MPSQTDLLNAYLNTSFEADVGTEIIRIRIGEKNSKLDKIMSKHDASSYVFITAYNPRSELLSKKQNAEKQKHLYKVLRTLKFEVFKGFGRPLGGNWEAEPSFLVLDVSYMLARGLCEQFRQNAVVFGRKGKEAKLIGRISYPVPLKRNRLTERRIKISKEKLLTQKALGPYEKLDFEINKILDEKVRVYLLNWIQSLPIIEQIKLSNFKMDDFLEIYHHRKGKAA